MLSRENQHDLCVYARKFNNLMTFGCWWFLNNPSFVQEITSERIEWLGTRFIPRHCDAQALEQLVCKWRNKQLTTAPILSHAYCFDDSGIIVKQQIQRDVTGSFARISRSGPGRVRVEPAQRGAKEAGKSPMLCGQGPVPLSRKLEESWR